MLCAAILKDCNIAAVVHGFRGDVPGLAAEETDHPREVIEAALAHVVGNKVEAASARSDLLERRWRLMDDWEASLAGERPRVPAPTGRTERLHAAQESATVIVTLSTATASSSPAARPLLTPCQVERLACTHSRPIRPRSGLDFTRSERRLRRRGGRRPRPDLEMRSGLHPEAVKSDGPGMGGEPLPLRRRTRPA